MKPGWLSALFVWLLACSSGTKHDAPKQALLGQECGYWNTCAEGSCLEGRCSPACARDAECAAYQESFGSDALVCAGKCRLCAQGPRCACPCPGGEWCDATAQACKPPQADGSPCTEGKQCQSSRCLAGVCSRGKPPGSACEAHEECEKFECYFGVCRERTGAPCSEDTCRGCYQGTCSACRRDGDQSYCANYCEPFTDGTLGCAHDLSGFGCDRQERCVKRCKTSADCLLDSEVCVDAGAVGHCYPASPDASVR